MVALRFVGMVRLSQCRVSEDGPHGESVASGYEDVDAHRPSGAGVIRNGVGTDEWEEKGEDADARLGVLSVSNLMSR